MITKTAKYGKGYNTPTGLEEDNYYEMMYDLIDYIKEKGLTVRQAQHLFVDCADMVLDTKPNEERLDTDYLKSIAESLNKISNKGVDTFSRCITTNVD